MRHCPGWLREGAGLPPVLAPALVACVLAGAPGAAADAGSSPARGPAERPADPHFAALEARPDRCSDVVRALAFYRARAQDLRARLELPAPERSQRPSSCRHARDLVARARALARGARRAYEAWFERAYEKWRCVHELEGSWTDPDPPYWGGLQMDYAFQRTYGREFVERWGTADRWPVWAQLRAAERAHAVRGWHPWPTTARRCGLIADPEPGPVGEKGTAQLPSVAPERRSGR